jgi:hypothetical protein
LPLIEHLAEHFHARHDGRLRGPQADDFDFVADLTIPAPARHHRAAPT